jgi:GGDEF domain-containing protein
LSGDEFVIVCEGLAGSIQDIHRWLRRFAERIVAELQPQVLASGTGVSVSIGAAVTRGACSAHALTTDADRAMYEAKAAGGGRLVISPADRVPTFRPRGRSALR